MIMNVLNNGEVVLSVEITTNSEVRKVLNRAYYELGLVKPDYEVVQA